MASNVAIDVRADGMLPDGSNPENVDPSPPLAWTRDSFTDVRLVSMPMSPPCIKIKYHLQHNGIACELLDSQKWKKSVPKGGYTKVPVLYVAGRQVNDSFIILKHLGPAIYGDRFDPEWEAKTTYGFQLALEVETFEDPGDYKTLLASVGIPTALYCGCLAGLLPLKKLAAKIKAARQTKDAQYGPLQPARSYADDFRRLLGDEPFAGGESAGATDISFYGTLAGFWSARLPSVVRLVRESGLEEWAGRMKELLEPAKDKI